MNYVKKQKYFTKGICCILILNMVFLSIGCGGYKNVKPESKFSKIQIGMGEKQVIDLLGPPNDESMGELWLNQILWVPMYLLIVGYIYSPPPRYACYYYKGEGRIYSNPGWGAVGRVSIIRVYKVEGDPTEDGYK